MCLGLYRHCCTLSREIFNKVCSVRLGKSFKGRFRRIYMAQISINGHLNLLSAHSQPAMGSLGEKEHNVVWENNSRGGGRREGGSCSIEDSGRLIRSGQVCRRECTLSKLVLLAHGRKQVLAGRNTGRPGRIFPLSLNPSPPYRPWCSRKPEGALGKGFKGSASPYEGRLE
jgi:hypothetical protein